MPQSWTIAGCQDTSRLLSVKPNQWTHLSPYYTRMHGEWLSYAKSTSQFHWRFLLSQRWSGLPSKSPMSSRHNVSVPSIRERYIRNRDVLLWAGIFFIIIISFEQANPKPKWHYKEWKSCLRLSVTVFWASYFSEWWGCPIDISKGLNYECQLQRLLDCQSSKVNLSSA